ncbi:ABC transporter ATP-binding protein [Terrabacter aerolatus]|uniref:ABC transporter n=1 Tax=Terrabacter aerolatus TaxID=422442 RepID=A0A512D1Q9_9MICO|nr:ABC transporter ATP-binding protein [Terrabacter aerolatus]GEO30409.1 ABC transporter [Terrabacter aerolatus]
MESSAAVRSRSTTKYYGDVVALDGVDLDIPLGQVHGLVGPNGAGKTTLLGLLLGLSVADRGTLEILGSPVRRVLGTPGGVSGFLDGPGLYPSLTARQNLAALAALRGHGAHVTREVEDALEQVGLSDVADDRPRGFSLGMRQRLGLAAALLARPRLLVLDEPSNGLDPAAKRHIHGLLGELAAGGAAVVVSSHHMDDVAALCSEVTLLSNGRVVFSGPVEKLAAESGRLDYRVVTSDPAVARRVVGETPGLELVSAPGGVRAEDDVVVARGPVSAVDELVVRLVGAGVAVRGLGPTVTPLEAAFLALTESGSTLAPLGGPR